MAFNVRILMRVRNTIMQMTFLAIYVIKLGLMILTMK